MSTKLASEHLRSGEIVLRCGEIPGQQIVDTVDRMIGDAQHRAAEIGLDADARALSPGQSPLA